MCRGSEEKTRAFLKKELDYDHSDIGPMLPPDTEARLVSLRELGTGVPIWILLFPEGEMDMPIAIHELYHLTQAVLKYHNIEDCETGAHLIEWLATELLSNEV